MNASVSIPPPRVGSFVGTPDWPIAQALTTRHGLETRRLVSFTGDASATRITRRLAVWYRLGAMLLDSSARRKPPIANCGSAITGAAGPLILQTANGIGHGVTPDCRSGGCESLVSKFLDGLVMEVTRHSPEQIVRKLQDVDRLLAEGQSVAEVVRQLSVAEQTYYRWRNQFGGLKAEDAKELRLLKDENAWLKKLLAEAELEKAMLKEVAEGNW